VVLDENNDLFDILNSTLYKVILGEGARVESKETTRRAHVNMGLKGYTINKAPRQKFSYYLDFYISEYIQSWQLKYDNLKFEIMMIP